MTEHSMIFTQDIGENLIIAPFSIVYDGCVIGNNVVIGEHAVIGRSLAPTKAMVRKEKERDYVKIGDDVSISAHAVIYKGVKMGKDCLIGDHASILSNVKIGDSVLISRQVTINSDVEIGDHTRIMDNTHITGRVKIGDHVFISVGVSMANDNLFGRNGFNDDVQGAVIEDFVSIGVGATILPNVKIGRGSIVAAGSVVKKDVPSGVIVAGNPAKVISKVPSNLRRDLNE
ncbi:acyltransferase [Ureibacillus massiliensis]|uniref:acyltransferase n=1 Tax=Ureibacillus massiliensis TaxID=292806 RepID=UPI00068C2B25|nr:acyltransferase [Ureibacillus massiliensis]